MTNQLSPVAVMQLPEAFNTERERLFFNELKSRMDASRPRVVLDCSKLFQLDNPTIHLLLCCLEEAMKRNGDVKLAAIPNGSSARLGLPGFEGLFEIFDTIPAAVDSFKLLPKGLTPQKDVPVSSHHNRSNGT
jgi:anti-anti-sigma regulatory factor